MFKAPLIHFIWFEYKEIVSASVVDLNKEGKKWNCMDTQWVQKSETTT